MRKIKGLDGLIRATSVILVIISHGEPFHKIKEKKFAFMKLVTLGIYYREQIILKNESKLAKLFLFELT